MTPIYIGIGGLFFLFAFVFWREEAAKRKRKREIAKAIARKFEDKKRGIY